MQPEAHQIGKWCFWHNDQNGWYTVVEISPVWEPAKEVSVEHVMRALANLRTQFEAPSELWQGIAHNIWQRLEAGEIEAVRLGECWLIPIDTLTAWYMYRENGRYCARHWQHEPTSELFCGLVKRWLEQELEAKGYVQTEHICFYLNPNPIDQWEQDFYALVCYTAGMIEPYVKRAYDLDGLVGFCQDTADLFYFFVKRAYESAIASKTLITIDTTTPLGRLTEQLISTVFLGDTTDTSSQPTKPSPQRPIAPNKEPGGREYKRLQDTPPQKEKSKPNRFPHLASFFTNEPSEEES